MPKAFDDCMKKGGKVRTKTLSKYRYRRYCILDGKTYLGHIKKKKKK